MLTLSCDKKKCKTDIVIPMNFLEDGFGVDFGVAVGWQLFPDGTVKCPKHSDKNN